MAEHLAASGLSSLSPPLLGGIVALLVLAAFSLPARAKPLTTLPLFFLLGLMHTAPALQLPADPNHIVRSIPGKTRATVVGTMLTMPVYNGKTTRFLLECESLLKAGTIQPTSFQPVRGKLQLTVEDALPASLEPGSRIMAIATLDRLHRYQTPGTFDYPLQMASKQVYCSGWIPSANAIEQVSDVRPGSPMARRLVHLVAVPEKMRQHMARFLEQSLPPEHAGLYQALLIGSLANIPAQTLAAFKNGGVFHLLAISGLHFSLLGLLTFPTLLFLLKRSHWLLVHTHLPSIALFLSAPILLTYAFIAGMNLPALRALITALLVLAAVLLHRQRSMLPLIAAAALLIWTCNPLAPFTASFQLSFAAVLAINLIYPRLPVLNEPSERQTGWLHIRARSLQIGHSMLLISLAATAGTLPLLLFHFHRVSLIGPLMNLVIEPLLCLWALPWGLLAFPLSWLAPDLAALCLHCGAWGLRAALGLIDSIPFLPALSLWTIRPSSLEIGLYYTLLFFLLQPPAVAHRRHASGVLAIILLGSLTFSLWSPWSNNHFSVHFLDVGQGTATLLRLPRGKNILIDGGGYESERFNSGEELIGPFLWQQRIWQLDTVIITHPHGDHYNGLPFVLEHFPPRQLIVNGDRGEESAYQMLLATARKRGIFPIPIRAHTILYEDGPIALHCLGMPGLAETSPWNTNDRSLVLRLTTKDHSFLFPADIGHTSEQVLLDSGADVQAQVLLAPHHGSRGSASERFIEAVAPQLIVVSAGRTREGILPAPRHLQRWRQQKICTLITAEDGTITLTSESNRLRARTFSGKEMWLRNKFGKLQKEKCDLKEKKNRGTFNH
nr:DNA internalization-related competence protein ComEC/Rec2 [uncultured Desulfobulbus sp.]